MTNPILNIQALATAAAKDKDFTKVSEGGSFERVLPIAGVGFIRLREYIELGIHPHGGVKFRKDKPLARFVFELTHKKHLQEFEKDGEKRFVPHTIAVTVPISDNASADYIKIFSALNWEQTATHPLQCIGKPLMCEVVISDNGLEGAEKREYVNLWKGVPKDKNWTIAPPIVKADPLDEDAKDKMIGDMIPKLIGGEESMKALLWAHCDEAQWNSIFIEGTRTEKGKDGAADKEVSKNWLQQKIMEAKNFPGSAAEQVCISGGQLDNLPTSKDEITKSVADVAETDAALAALGM